MLTFARLLKLSGRPILTEDLSPQQATSIFKYYGATDADLKDPALLKKAYFNMIKSHHPDKIGPSSVETAKEINVAYAVLRSVVGGAGSPSAQSPAQPQPQQQPYSPPSRAAAREDLQSIKQKFRSMAGRFSQEYTVVNFDGFVFRGSFKIAGSPSLFPEMAKAMRDWDINCDCRAVFIVDDSGLKLIWSDGRDRSPPILFARGFNNQQANLDRQFLWNVKEALDKIRAQ